jgi:diacylglycerol kinase (ATP)
MFNSPVPDKILFIANPTSRIIDKEGIRNEISRLSGEFRFSWEIYYTEKEKHELKIREKINEFKPGLVVAIGGDGTINPVATALIGSNMELGIIPAGSANGLAYNLGIPSGFTEAINLILNESAKPLDAIILNNTHYCYHLSDIGINARIVKRFEQEGSKGLVGYGRQMIKELFSKRDIFSFTIRMHGRKKRFSAELLAIANARYFGTGAVINPAGRIDDGRFEIIVIKPYPWWAIFYLIRMFLFGSIEDRRFVRILSGTEAEISFDKKQDLQVDGEIIRGIGRMQIRILPSAVKVRYRHGR